MPFLGLILMPVISVSSMAEAGVGQGTYLLSTSGSIVDKVSIDVGEFYSGRSLSRQFQLDYSFQSANPNTLVVIESPTCFVLNKRMDNVRALVGSKSLFAARDVLASGFTLDFNWQTPDDVEGEFSCQGGEFRDLNSGALIAQIEVSGFVHRVPRWTDPLGVRLSNIYFSFEGQLAGLRPNLDIESRPVPIRLLHASFYPAMVLYSAPEGCRIGSFSVQPNYMVLRYGATMIENGGVWSIPNADTISLRLRISAQALMGDKSGQLRCEEKGLLRYTY